MSESIKKYVLEAGSEDQWSDDIRLTLTLKPEDVCDLLRVADHFKGNNICDLFTCLSTDLGRLELELVHDPEGGPSTIKVVPFFRTHYFDRVI